MSDVVIREARDDELDEIGRQRVEAYSQYKPDMPAFWDIYAADLGDARKNAEHGTVFAIEVDERLVGSATVHWDLGEPETLFLTMVAILPEARGRGAADRVMDHVLAHAREIGAKILKWNTAAFMTPARRFYTRLGYQPEQEREFAGTTLLTYRVKV